MIMLRQFNINPYIMCVYSHITKKNDLTTGNMHLHKLGEELKMTEYGQYIISLSEDQL